MIPQETGNGTDGAGVGGIYERNGELMRWLVKTFACFRVSNGFFMLLLGGLR